MLYVTIIVILIILTILKYSIGYNNTTSHCTYNNNNQTSSFLSTVNQTIPDFSIPNNNIFTTDERGDIQIIDTNQFANEIRNIKNQLEQARSIAASLKCPS